MIDPVLHITEYTDPGCVWAWGSEPKVRWLQQALGRFVRWRQVIGLQYTDFADLRPGVDPDTLGPDFEEQWRRVALETGAPWPRNLKRVHRSSWPLGLAIKAASRQSDDLHDRVLRRLREAIFVFGDPPNTAEDLRRSLAGVDDLDLDRLVSDMSDPLIALRLQADWEQARSPRSEVIGVKEPLPHPGGARRDGARLRYAFPTLVISGPAGDGVVPGWRPLQEYIDTINEVAPEFGLQYRVLGTPEDMLARWGSLTIPDLTLLTGATVTPPEAMQVDRGGGPLWYASATGRILPWQECALAH